MSSTQLSLSIDSRPKASKRRPAMPCRLEDAILDYTEERKQAKDFATRPQQSFLTLAEVGVRSFDDCKGREAQPEGLKGQENRN